MNQNIYYLENLDIGGDNSLKPYVTEGKPVVVMCQATNCGHCTNAKPAYESVSTARNDIKFCTIQLDGGPTESVLSKNIKQWYPDFQGVPVFLGFNKDGAITKVYSGDRSAQSISQFADSLLH